MGGLKVGSIFRLLGLAFSCCVVLSLSHGSWAIEEASIVWQAFKRVCKLGGWCSSPKLPHIQDLSILCLPANSKDLFASGSQCLQYNSQGHEILLSKAGGPDLCIQGCSLLFTGELVSPCGGDFCLLVRRSKVGDGYRVQIQACQRCVGPL